MGRENVLGISSMDARNGRRIKRSYFRVCQSDPKELRKHTAMNAFSNSEKTRKKLKKAIVSPVLQSR